MDAMLTMRPQRRAAAVEDAGHVHRDDLLPNFVGDFPHRRGASGVVAIALASNGLG
jgi:hypothetical protein